MSTNFSDEEIIAICKKAFPGLTWSADEASFLTDYRGVSPVLEISLFMYENGAIVEASFMKGDYLFRSTNKAGILPGTALQEVKEKIESFLCDLKKVMGS